MKQMNNEINEKERKTDQNDKIEMDAGNEAQMKEEKNDDGDDVDDCGTDGEHPEVSACSAGAHFPLSSVGGATTKKVADHAPWVLSLNACMAKKMLRRTRTGLQKSSRSLKP